MNRQRRGRRARPASRPTCEMLEGRDLPSGLNLPASLQSSLLAGIHQHTIKTTPAGIAAILEALRGGPGNEFVKLVRSELKDPSALLREFTSGATNEASIRGLATRTATILDTFKGAHLDDLAVSTAGAVLLSRHRLELAALLRGPNDTTKPAYYVFGIDRGAGASVGPRFAERPGITPDALVSITVQPGNTNPTGTITDLTSGAVTAVDPARIQVQGSTLRVILDTAQLPSRGLPTARYRFAFWSQSQAGGGFDTVGSLVPDTTMIPVRVVRGG